ncbi:unnamed protein product [Leuciscus chuanchicus]
MSSVTASVPPVVVVYAAVPPVVVVYAAVPPVVVVYAAVPPVVVVYAAVPPVVVVYVAVPPVVVVYAAVPPVVVVYTAVPPVVVVYGPQWWLLPPVVVVRAAVPPVLEPLGQELALVDGVPGEREVVGVGAFTTVVEVRLPELTPLSKDARGRKPVTIQIHTTSPEQREECWGLRAGLLSSPPRPGGGLSTVCNDEHGFDVSGKSFSQN